MILAHRLAKTLNALEEQRPEDWPHLMSVVDLTLLNPLATTSDLQALSQKATEQNVAAICVLPEHLHHLQPQSHIKRATVVNFPSGEDLHQHVLETIEHIASNDRANEIDYVFPYRSYLAGQHKEALTRCHEAYLHCKQHQLLFKVILETGALPSMEMVYQLSLDVIQGGCDFLKTSTGKIDIGATTPAVFAMLSAIIESGSMCGIKISGGIKTTAQAMHYLHLTKHVLQREINPSCFRIGSSAMLRV